MPAPDLPPDSFAERLVEAILRLVGLDPTPEARRRLAPAVQRPAK